MQTGCGTLSRRPHDARDGRVGVAPGENGLPSFVDALSNRVAHQIAGNAFEKRLKRGVVKHFFDLRKRAKLIVGGLGCHSGPFERETVPLIVAVSGLEGILACDFRASAAARWSAR